MGVTAQKNPGRCAADGGDEDEGEGEGVCVCVYVHACARVCVHVRAHVRACLCVCARVCREGELVKHSHQGHLSAETTPE